jgi:ankyrin repeat protein
LLHKLDFGHVDGVRWFLDHGADPNADSSSRAGSVAARIGYRPLHWAIMRPGPSAMAELLLEHGADPNRRTAAGHTALDLAERWYGRVELVPTLERHGAERSPRSALDELVVAAAYGDEARARALLRKTPELLSSLREEDRSLVPAFAETGNARGASILIRLGFDAAATSWMGLTAVHWAAIHGSAEWVHELLAAGAPLLDVPGFGTPLHTALYNHWFREGPGANDYAGVVRVLLAAGAVIPDDLRPSGDAELDALIETAREELANRRQ